MLKSKGLAEPEPCFAGPEGDGTVCHRKAGPTLKRNGPVPYHGYGKADPDVMKIEEA